MRRHQHWTLGVPLYHYITRPLVSTILPTLVLTQLDSAGRAVNTLLGSQTESLERILRSAAGTLGLRQTHEQRQ